MACDPCIDNLCRKGINMQDKYCGKINILHLLEGARQARGFTVIIDVFRAFSLECYFYAAGAKLIRPVGSLDEAYMLKKQYPDCLLAGERKGRKCDGFDYGNSPCTINEKEVQGKTIIHTTSSGTQGIVNAVGAEKIITGSLVNARAIAEYILKTQPAEVSLVCMGSGGVLPAVEDELCAEYIRSLLLGEEFPGMEQKIQEMTVHGAEHFFTPETQDVFPEKDFWLCTMTDRFNFVLIVEKDIIGYVSRRVDL